MPHAVSKNEDWGAAIQNASDAHRSKESNASAVPLLADGVSGTLAAHAFGGVVAALPLAGSADAVEVVRVEKSVAARLDTI